MNADRNRGYETGDAIRAAQSRCKGKTIRAEDAQALSDAYRAAHAYHAPFRYAPHVMLASKYATLAARWEDRAARIRAGQSYHKFPSGGVG